MGLPLAVFCCEASPKIGWGHVIRSQALADELSCAGWKCEFWTDAETLASLGPLKDSRFKWIEIPGLGLDLQNFLQKEPCDLLVVDNYRLDAEFETACRVWAHRILVIDDLANRPHDCDILIDQTAGRRAGDYTEFVGPNCLVLAGPDYGLLRPQFLGRRAEALARRSDMQQVDRVLVSLGGGDSGRLPALVLGAISDSGLDIQIDLVVGPSGIHDQELRRILPMLGNRVVVHSGVEDMAGLMVAADLAVGAAGSSSWERCVLALPTVMIGVAENQRAITQELSRLGAVEFGGWADQVDRAGLARLIADLAADPGRRGEMAEAAARICDGRGTQRVMLSILDAAQRNESVRLRIMEASDEELVLEWQRHPLTRRFARNPGIPTREEHARWFRSRLSDPDCLLCMVIFEGAPAGVLRFDCIDSNRARREVSILISPEMHRRGIAGAALEKGRQLLPGVDLVAEVLPGNTGSERLFLTSGYRRYHDGLLYNSART